MQGNAVNLIGDIKDFSVFTFKRALGLKYAYDEPVRQGLRTPSVQVLFRDISVSREFDKRSRVDISLNANVFPENSGPGAETELAEYALKSWQIRHLTDFNGVPTYHVNGLSANIVDGVLVIRFSVATFIRFDEVEILMEDLDLKREEL